MRGQFRRSFESLEEIFAFTESFFSGRGIDSQHRFAVNFVIEELFTNMVKYNPGGVPSIAVELQQAGNALQVRLSDREAAPFDVARPRPVDPDAPVEEREAGGLGLYLVQRLVDTLDYQHADGVSTITFTRKLDRDHV